MPCVKAVAPFPAWRTTRRMTCEWFQSQIKRDVNSQIYLKKEEEAKIELTNTAHHHLWLNCLQPNSLYDYTTVKLRVWYARMWNGSTPASLEFAQGARCAHKALELSEEFNVVIIGLSCARTVDWDKLDCSFFIVQNHLFIALLHILKRGGCSGFCLESMGKEGGKSFF